MAGRITQVFIDDLLDRVDIVDIIDRRVKLKKTGKNYSACCPFHDEKTPSFSVNPDKQFYYCFGCGAGGNAIGFIMDYDNVDFPQAVENLADHAGLTVVREQTSANRPPPQQREGLYDSLEQAACFYQLQLRKHPEAHKAINYLKGRGLSGEIAKQYAVGFAPPGWDNLLSSFIGDKPDTAEDVQKNLLKCGLVIENEKGRIYDRFRDRIVFPIKDQRGRVIAFGGRVLGDDKPKYLNSPETDVFHKGRELYGLYEAKKTNRKLDKIVVVEGYMDVIALAQHGIHNAVATLGTATSEAHLERIYRLCPEVVFCFDGDEAGRKAAVRALENALPCMEDGRQARFLFLPEGEDPDTLVREKGADYFQQLVSESNSLETFMFESISTDLDISTIDGRARLSKLALPMIERIPEGVYRQLMFGSLAQRTGLDVGELMRLMQTLSTIQQPAYAVDQPPPDYEPTQEVVGEHAPRQREPLSATQNKSNNLAQQAIALLVHHPEIARSAKNPDIFASAEKGDLLLLHKLLQVLHRSPEYTSARLMGRWHGTADGEAINHIANQEHPLLSAEVDIDNIEQQFADTLHKLQQQKDNIILEALLDKLRARNYAELSASEKLQLGEYLQQKDRLTK